MDGMVTTLQTRHAELTRERDQLVTEMRQADAAQARRGAMVNQIAGALGEIERILALVSPGPSLARLGPSVTPPADGVALVVNGLATTAKE